MAPYRLDDGRILVAPRRLIPLPEAQDYQVRVEQRVAETSAVAGKAAARRNQILDEIARQFNAGDTRVEFNERVNSHYRIGQAGVPHVHYEFLWRTREDGIAVGIHFEARQLEVNVKREQAITRDIASNGRRELRGRWGSNEVWTRYERLVPFNEPDLPSICAREMRSLVDETWERVCVLREVTPEAVKAPRKRRP